MANKTSRIKRQRRTKADVQRIRDAIVQELQDEQPMTNRQIFYLIESRGLIAKTENEYRNTICRLLADMRRDETIPYGWIADNTRWMRKPTTFDSLHAMFEDARNTYRRALWRDQYDYVEIWLEKDALAGVLYRVTEEYDVPLMVTRGYPSLSFMHEAAAAIQNQGKPTYIYYLGDHDPSGLDIDRVVQERIGEFAPGADVHFGRLAVLPWQIDEWQLPTRPTKKKDTRSKGFDGESVEVDAIPASVLRRLVEQAIQSHIDHDVLAVTERLEELERDSLREIVAGMNGGAT